MTRPDIRLTMFLPPDDTLRVWDLRGELRTTVRWHEMMNEDHAAAFTVAKVAQLDLLRQIRTSLDDALRNGRTFESWKAELVPQLQKAGWWGMVTDPALTGSDRPVLVNERRLQTIFRTNVRMSQAAARWLKIQTEKDRFPYLRYLSDHYRKEPRKDHRSWHGLILPVDHPWWLTHFPPNGWGCNCHYEQVSQARMDRKGWKVSTPPDDGPDTLFFAAGRKQPLRVPAGIHPGFGYNPGIAHLRAVADKTFSSIRLAEEAGLEEPARRLVADLLADPAFEQFIALPDQPFPFAWLDSEKRGWIAARSGMVRLSRATRDHIVIDRRRDYLGVADFRLAASLIDRPLYVFRERGTHLVFFGRSAEGRIYRVVVKTTADGSENYLSTIYPSDRRGIAAKLRSADSELVYQAADDA